MHNLVAGIASWIRGEDPHLEALAPLSVRAPHHAGPAQRVLPALVPGAKQVRVMKVFSENSLGVFEIEVGLEGSDYACLPVLGFLEGKHTPTELRLYHSGWALHGKHQVRPPLFAKNQTVELPGPLRDYHHALRAGEVDPAVSLFNELGSIREPSGDVHGHGGTVPLRSFFVGAFGPGGIGIRYHSLVSAAPFFAAEYTCFSWGKDIPPQAGGEVWEVSGNKLSAVRIYDDVEQPKT